MLYMTHPTQLHFCYQCLSGKPSQLFWICLDCSFETINSQCCCSLVVYSSLHSLTMLKRENLINRQSVTNFSKCGDVVDILRLIGTQCLCAHTDFEVLSLTGTSSDSQCHDQLCKFMEALSRLKFHQDLNWTEGAVKITKINSPSCPSLLLSLQGGPTAQMWWVFKIMWILALTAQG